MKVDPRRAAKQSRIARSLGQIGFALPGSLTVRAYPCGKRNCRCKAEPPQLHGPYAFWTRKIDGKTVTRLLSDDELAELKPWFDNARRLRELTSQLQELTLELVKQVDDTVQPRSRPSASTKAARAKKRTGDQ